MKSVENSCFDCFSIRQQFAQIVTTIIGVDIGKNRSVWVLRNGWSLATEAVDDTAQTSMTRFGHLKLEKKNPQISLRVRNIDRKFPGDLLFLRRLLFEFISSQNNNTRLAMQGFGQSDANEISRFQITLFFFVVVKQGPFQRHSGKTQLTKKK